MTAGALKVLISRVLTHFNQRPDGVLIDTIIIHSISNPACDKPFLLENCISILDQHKVSAHYLISRKGEIVSLIDEAARAYHAGVSVLPASAGKRENVNDFSIGIEVIGAAGEFFTDNQYDSLIALTRDILSRHPIRYILGHEHIAPGRKIDPGPSFDWQRLTPLKVSFPEVKLPPDIVEFG